MTAEQERAAVVRWLRERRFMVSTGCAAVICVILFHAGGEAFAALIMSVWAFQLAEEVDELRADAIEQGQHLKGPTDGHDDA